MKIDIKHLLWDILSLDHEGVAVHRVAARRSHGSWHRGVRIFLFFPITNQIKLSRIKWEILTFITLRLSNGCSYVESI